RTARQIDHDGRFAGGRLALRVRGGRAEPEQVGEGEASAEGADLKEATTADAVAEVLFRPPDGEHDSPPSNVERLGDAFPNLPGRCRTGNQKNEKRRWNGGTRLAHSSVVARDVSGTETERRSKWTAHVP